MPRDGSGIYTKPFLDVVEGTTIESAVHNGTVSDIETDLNAARPIVAGGTGATSAAGARNNLDVEVAAAQVTNFDSHVWETGSFWSGSSATGSPVAGHTYAGIAIIANNDPNYITIRTVDLQDGLTWTRLKTAGTWGAWTSEQAHNDARFVNVTGDGMTGDLQINKANPAFGLRKTDNGQNNGLNGYHNSASRWSVVIGNAAVESGSNSGSDFNIIRFDDAGTAIDVPIAISRATGLTTLTGSLSVSGAATATQFDVSGFSGFALNTSAGGTERNLQFFSGTRIIGADDGNIYFQNGGINSFRVTIDGHLAMVAGTPYRAGGGPWVDSSDARIKTVQGDYEHGLAEVLTLQPVRYVFNGNDTISPPTEPDVTSPHAAVAASNREFIGLVAQAVEGAMPEMVSLSDGYIDGQHVTDLRNLDTTPLIFALINAVKELTARLEALEAVP